MSARDRLADPAVAAATFQAASTLVTNAVGEMHDALSGTVPGRRAALLAAFAVDLGKVRTILGLDDDGWEALLLASLTMLLAAYHEVTCAEEGR